MGITGLLPFLKKIHSPVNISQFSGCTVAIDAYCWLHRGAFSCAEKLAVGEPTEQYVYYCMKYVNYLLSKDIKPILVLDGAHLPSKRDVEKTRRERREVNRKKAAQFLREGKKAEARDCFQKCVDITPAMALKLMKACRAKGVDCIVAPYEADAQLAYLNRSGIAQAIITEDSDLLLFGCDKVIFKMDFYGNGILIEQSRLNEVMDINTGLYSFDKFRYMCIMSGCDYLPSIPGIGLAKACKVFKTARQPDLKLILKKIPTYLNMKIVVGEDYIEGFIRADNTFLYQLAFDPCQRKLVPLTPYPPEISPNNVEYAGPYKPRKEAYQTALGNIDLYSGEMVCDYDPDLQQPAQRKHSKKKDFLSQLSMWDKQYRPSGKLPALRESQPKTSDHRPSTAGIERVVEAKFMKRLPLKRNREEEEKEAQMAEEEMTDMYAETPPSPRKKRFRKQSASSSSDESANDSDKDKEKTTVKRDSRHLWDVMQQDKENSEREATSTPRRNKFALSPGSLKKQRFDINAISEGASSKTEVKSRFFKSQPKICLQKKPQKSISDFVSNESKVDVDSSLLEKSEGESRFEIAFDGESETELTTSQSSGVISTRSARTPLRKSPSAFSWSKFKFAKQRNQDGIISEGEFPQNSSANTPFKQVTVPETNHRSKPESEESTQVNLETEENDCCDTKTAVINDKLTVELAPSDSQISVVSQDRSSYFGKFCLSQPSIHTVDLTDSGDVECWSSQKFASQESRKIESTTVTQETAEMLSISPPSSKLSLLSSTSKSACRVSGLSRGKGKTTLTKPTSSGGQNSIKNMFAKFAHRSKSEGKLRLNHTKSYDDLNLTPVLSQPNPSTSSDFIPRQIIL